MLKEPRTYKSGPRYPLAARDADVGALKSEERLLVPKRAVMGLPRVSALIKEGGDSLMGTEFRCYQTFAKRNGLNQPTTALTRN